MTLRTAAAAVLARWDSPQWEWTQHGPTADLMHVLRAELAQPAAPDVTPEDAHPMYQLGWKAGYKHGAWSDKPAPDAQPDKWDGAEEWMPLAWELCAEECGEEACTEIVWEGGPIPEPWGDRWLKYEDEAKRLIALVRKCTAGAALAQPAAPDVQPVAWLGGDGHPHHISAVQTVTERNIYGPWVPLYAAAQAAQPAPIEFEETDPDNCEHYCPHCGGSGEVEEADSAGPDARMVPVSCPHCDGHGTLIAAYRGAVNLLLAAQRKYLQACADWYRLKHADPLAGITATAAPTTDKGQG